MDLGLHGKVAFVSGASAGLGRAIAAELVAEGATVAIASRSRMRIDATAGEIGATGFVWDTADVDAAAGLLDTVAVELGPVDVLVTNTGGPPRGDPLGFTRAQWEAAYRSLVLAPMALVEHALPGMRARGCGRIVNVASTSVREPIGQLMLSNSHRAAMVTAFKTIAVEVAPDGVTLNTLLPGHFATARILDLGPREQIEEDARRTLPIERLGEPKEFAAAAVFLCSARASYITGETLAVDGGKTRSVF
ncbi:MAG: 3-oxoacyl-[acyl-carrier protein] reductase [uncultured Solirubrobacteraceae bacterium]|uniref:3-oxoacyl-[acyl-carrier protein] reductase n=1 Tax=uncultured Solirubrobacteraceae bacterium TaxID=1162706 RepID=A0A6J4SKE5_9ACTN|nr:MAG: 3-oxoacyl-[acyl-carrier protein] reductase [uncultured Solirubrobacteraceae bacterium]